MSKPESGRPDVISEEIKKTLQQLREFKRAVAQLVGDKIPKDKEEEEKDE